MADPDPLDFAIDLDTVRDRVRALNYFLTVETIGSAAEAMRDMGGQVPAAYVSVAMETASQNKLIGGYRQFVAVQISILVAENIARGDRDAEDTIERSRKAVIRQMVGFTPGRAETYCQFDRYLLRAIDDRCIWGEVLFRTAYKLTA